VPARARWEVLACAGRALLGGVFLEVQIPAMSRAEAACVQVQVCWAMDVLSIVTDAVEKGDVVVKDHGGGNHFDSDFVICVDVLEKKAVSVWHNQT